LRIAAQFLALFLLCLAGCWLLNHVVRSRPMVISGKVIDWGTGQPAPYTDVLIAKPNFSQPPIRTDAHGQFTFVAPQPDVYFLFVSAPRYGKLLQTLFGNTVIVYRPGDRVRNVVIPAIPATGLSGHVYGTDGRPIPACDVSAITRDNLSDKFLDVESAGTGADGSYTFPRLGADRYFVLARCGEPIPDKGYPRFVWEPLAYPQATSIAKAREILLLPGQHRADIDFHMQRKRSYVLEGKVVFSDGSPPKPWGIYDHDVRMLRSDHAFASIWLERQECGWNANTGTFRCYSLLPGTYTLYFDLSGISFQIPKQFARVTYTVQPNAKQPALTVQLHNVPAKPSQTPQAGSSGFLDLRKVCGAAAADKPQIEVLLWGHRPAAAPCYLMSFFGNTMLPLPEDTYTVNAFEDAFTLRHAYLAEQSKFESILMQRGVRVRIRAGQKHEPVLPVLTTSDLIEIALKSLRPDD
jgi:hypothetical protein